MLIQKIHRTNLKYKMNAVLERTHTGFEKLTLTLDTYSACKLDEKEIRYKGHMYDVKSKTIIGNTIELLVINDKEEERLMAHMEATANLLDESTQGTATIKLKFLQLIFLCPAVKEKLPVEGIHEINFVSLIQTPVLLPGEIPSPPPRG